MLLSTLQKVVLFIKLQKIFKQELKKKKKPTEKVWNIFSTWANGNEPAHQSGFVINFIKTTYVSLGLHWDMLE